MLKILRHFYYLLLLLPVVAFAANTPNTDTAPFKAGKDYQLTAIATGMPLPPKHKVDVVEFFSFACPACFNFEPSLEKWLKNKPADVHFDRIPVVFESGWDVLARGYYTAKNLNVSEKLAPAIFNAIQVQGQDLTNATNLEQFFIAHGVSKSDFENTYNFSPGMDGQMLRGDNLMRLYHILQVPTVVIDGKYKVDPSMTGGNYSRMLQVIDYLIAQERKNLKK